MKKMIGWKKCKVYRKDDYWVRHCIVKLEIRGEVVLDGYGIGGPTKKCRTSEAKVLKIYGLKKGDTAVSMHDGNFEYKTGRIVKPTTPFVNNGEACAPGIHFFRTKKEAANY